MRIQLLAFAFGLSVTGVFAQELPSVVGADIWVSHDGSVHGRKIGPLGIEHSHITPLEQSTIKAALPMYGEAVELRSRISDLQVQILNQAKRISALEQLSKRGTKLCKKKTTGK